MHGNTIRSSHAMALASIALACTSALFAGTFGTWCTRSYEGGWQHSLDYATERCSRFNNELDDTDTKLFYYNLNGAKPYLENEKDQIHTERAGLIWLSTHGGAWPDTAAFAMWNKNAIAFTKNMRLGDESVGTAILATYACATLKEDSLLITRWRNVMRGGLRFVTGSHGTLTDGPTTDECGEDFADDLQGGMTIKAAWKSALSDWATDQDASVLATGETAAECSSRRDNMKWQNFASYRRLRDNQNVHYCRTYWSNL